MLAPTAFTKKRDREVVRIFRDVASVIPVFGFELQRLVPGSREFNYRALGEDLHDRVRCEVRPVQHVPRPDDAGSGSEQREKEEACAGDGE